MTEKRQLVIIGAGPAGLAAALGAYRQGIKDILILERDSRPGGILNQCIHDGFGLIRFQEVLTGPEYAGRFIEEALTRKIEILTNTAVISMTSEKQVTLLSDSGMRVIQAESIVLATGCRERTRGALAIPGTRPAGIFTAGLAQNLINRKNIMPGKKIVILGSGDIGLIMARRFVLEGAQVLAVVEIGTDSGGLTRNICQCLFDFGIPIYLNSTVIEIKGSKRLESVVVAKVDDKKQAVRETAQEIFCDTLVLSVGLIPENEIAAQAGVLIDPATNGAMADPYLQTNIPGIFVCGNARRVLDLADFVSEEGELAGENAALFIRKEKLKRKPLDKANEMPKGLPPKDVFICTVCPRGCQITAKKNGTELYNIKGNGCIRGVQHIREEALHAGRVVTTTVRSERGGLIPVKTKGKIPKADMRHIIKELNAYEIPEANTYHGQIIGKDIIPEVDIISTAFEWDISGRVIPEERS